MRRSLGLTCRGLRLTGGARALGTPPGTVVLVTETGAPLVDELGRALAAGDAPS